MYSKHRILEITADFEIEPIIEDYLKKYPNEDYAGYKVLLKLQDEHNEGEFSYVILLTKGTPQLGKKLSFHNFVKAYCTYSKCHAVMSDHTLPNLSQPNVLGASDTTHQESDAQS